MSCVVHARKATIFFLMSLTCLGGIVSVVESPKQVRDIKEKKVALHVCSTPAPLAPPDHARTICCPLHSLAWPLAHPPNPPNPCTRSCP